MSINRLEKLFEDKSNNILNIYFTAGYPKIDDTTLIINTLSSSGVDLIEVGMPYSDPLADGPVIQQSSEVALANGMKLSLLFEQIKKARQSTEVPIVMMGYVNQVMQYGVERFLSEAATAGVDGLILPDLPLSEYENELQTTFKKYNLGISFLITPQTPDERMRKIERLSSGFIYVVSSAATTGAQATGNSTSQEVYFEKIKGMQFLKPTLIGFGISSPESFQRACRYANGAIIGSAFIKMLSESKNLSSDITSFVKHIRS